jgi:hypothetical protein
VSAKLDTVVAQLAEKALDGYISSLSLASQQPQEPQSKQAQQLLSSLLETFKNQLFSSPNQNTFTDKLDSLVSTQAYEMLKADSGVFLAILGSRGAVETLREAWVSVLRSLAESESDERERERLVGVLVGAAQGGRLPECLKIHAAVAEERGVLDEFVGKSVAQIVNSQGGDAGRGRVEGVKGLLVHRGMHPFFILW